jgi:hypothetical protein
VSTSSYAVAVFTLGSLLSLYCPTVISLLSICPLTSCLTDFPKIGGGWRLRLALGQLGLGIVVVGAVEELKQLFLRARARSRVRARAWASTQPGTNQRTKSCRTWVSSSTSVLEAENSLCECGPRHKDAQGEEGEKRGRGGGGKGDTYMSIFLLCEAQLPLLAQLTLQVEEAGECNYNPVKDQVSEEGKRRGRQGGYIPETASPARGAAPASARSR